MINFATASMIGVYDSGVGGLSVLRELLREMPGEDYDYFSDGAYCPYGPKPPQEIVLRARTITEEFIRRGAEMIVVACNTATAAAISELRARYILPFIGMEPAIKPAALHSASGVVGVLATAGTFKGRLYLDTLARFASDVKVIEQVGTGLVEAVERGDFDSPQVEALLRRYITPMVEAGADHIVLGCTHYPFLEEAIRRIAGEGITIVNPAPAVARHARKILSTLRPPRTEGTGSRVFRSSGDDTILKQLASTLV